MSGLQDDRYSAIRTQTIHWLASFKVEQIVEQILLRKFGSKLQINEILTLSIKPFLILLKIRLNEF
jgi:hypothetical protein